MILFALLSFIAPLGALGFFGYLGLRFVRAREREGQSGAGDSGQRSLMRLEEQVHALQSEVDALRERQDFTERLLDRPRDNGNTES